MKNKSKQKSIVTHVQSRKDRRKLDRQKRKRRDSEDDQPPPVLPTKNTGARPTLDGLSQSKKKEEVKNKKHKKDQVKEETKIAKSNDPYAHLDPATAAALRRDDEEIAYLERNLGMTNKKQKQRLGKEFAKLEGYGDDFGDFLDDLDGLVGRIARDTGSDCDDASDGDSMLGSKREDESVDSYSDGSSDEVNDDEDEELPMKDDDGLDDDDSVMEELEAEERTADETVDDEDEDDMNKSDEEEDEEEGEDEEEEEEEEIGAEVVPDTYRPSKGEDIYGKRKLDSGPKSAPSKYVPPHLRKQQEDSSDKCNDKDDKAQLAAARQVRRALNQILNRLSEDNVVSVCQEVVQTIYPANPTSVVNECLWSNAQNACVAPHLLMSGLIPVYMAAVTGVHYLMGDTAQLSEYLVEQCVTILWEQRQTPLADNGAEKDEPADPISDKSASNLTLMLCYLYNFGAIHCTLLYDLIREFISDFSERDIELLLLMLSHSGRSLRSDDPTSLKDIVLLVQKRALEVKGTIGNYSRVDYMVSAINDLKNNKKRKQDEVFTQKTSKLRKMLGQIKSIAAKTAIRADSSLRLSLDDILNAETKGRWWKIGASWIGNQHQFTESGENDKSEIEKVASNTTVFEVSDEEQARLLKLAAKYRMNTDVRRSIFCIIMGSADCEDAFEKLVRAGMLKGRNERETVRVLMECCGSEKEFNKVYAYLAARIAEYQPQSKFSFQLAFWDMFKQFDDMKIRKAANYAKLLFQLVVVHRTLKLNVLKAIDLASPDELPEAAMIFATLFFSAVMDHCEAPSDAAELFAMGVAQKKPKKDAASASDELDLLDEGDALRASFTIFFVRVLKSSPKYKKGSKFRANLKAALKSCDVDGMMQE
ncbi:hypothetical protein MPSEU_000503200 [Mayamaea pseudoterrestris]|nr:hypothetical protein MPSEU_000503200 [Mayamaea pseudoterrestris]